jgi:virginiamycin B lyase
MNLRASLLLATVLAACIVAGCGGGGSAPAPPAGAGASASASTQSGTIGLTFGSQTGTTSAQRRPSFVSTNATTAVVSINNGTATTFNVASGSALCQTSVGGVRTCAIPLNAPAGQDSISVSLMASVSGTATLLGQGSNSVTVVQGTPFTVSVGVNPVVAGTNSISFSTGATLVLSSGTPGVVTATVVFEDPADTPITGSGNVPNFLAPVTLTSNDANVVINPATLTTPGQTFTITYNGSVSVAPSVTISVMQGSNLLASATTATVAFSEYTVPTANSEPYGITVGPDGALWFAESHGTANKIARITTAGVVTNEFTIPTATSVPQFIVTGPDNNLWFTENLGFKIGRMTTAGVFNEYPIPTGLSFPVGITAGPDGALWFTESGANANNIGRITTLGAITEYPIPTQSSSPQLIAPGPDGALWFTESQGNKIGRITTSGAITEYPIPSINSLPAAIVAGPDGAMWFMESNSNGKVGRITTAGVITNEYPVPTAGGGAYYGMAVGADGAIWFAELGGNKIGRITTAGVVSEYMVPTPSSLPNGLTLGPDNAIWFTEYLGNKVGRFP